MPIGIAADTASLNHRLSPRPRLISARAASATQPIAPLALAHIVRCRCIAKEIPPRAPPRAQQKGAGWPLEYLAG